jgi:hypothetical protein
VTARRSILAGLAIAAIFSLAETMADGPITPLQTRLSFSSQPSQSNLRVPINSSNGELAYWLSLEPNFDVKNQVVGLTLVLRRPRDGTHANRFDPTGRWHGLQKWIFAAGDFAQGVEKSAYGPRRTVALEWLGLGVDINVLSAIASPSGGFSGDYKWDALELQVNVKNETAF